MSHSSDSSQTSHLSDSSQVLINYIKVSWSGTQISREQIYEWLNDDSYQSDSTRIALVRF